MALLKQIFKALTIILLLKLINYTQYLLVKRNVFERDLKIDVDLDDLIKLGKQFQIVGA